MNRPRAREWRLRIGRVVVEAAAPGDRAALAASLARELPGAIAARLRDGAPSLTGRATVAERIADAVAAATRARLP